MLVYSVAAHRLSAPGEMVVQASEGRWPRICARPTIQRHADETGRCGNVL
ncbi:MAG: hypothetical protein ACM3N4_04320 [Nitrososphaerota archaeon]